MSNLAMWALVGGFFTPPVLALIQQTGWTPGVRAICTFLWCVLLAAVEVIINGDWTTHKFIQTALLVLVTAISSYKGLWKPTGVAPAIELQTNFNRWRSPPPPSVPPPVPPPVRAS